MAPGNTAAGVDTDMKHLGMLRMDLLGGKKHSARSESLDIQDGAL